MGQLREARAELESVRRLLLSPGVARTEGSTAGLERAVTALRQAEMTLTNASLPLASKPGIEAQLRGVRTQLAEIGALLDGAARFHLGWARALAEATRSATYDAQGRVSGSEPAGRLSLDG